MLLKDFTGKDHDLSDGKVVLFCYPKDDTPGCTIEAQEFSALYNDFAKKGIRVFGISKGDVKSKNKFTIKCSLSVPLLVDQELTFLTKLGVVKDKSMFGKPYKGIERSTFYFENGKIKKEWRNVNHKGHAQQVLDEV